MHSQVAQGHSRHAFVRLSRACECTNVHAQVRCILHTVHADETTMNATVATLATMTSTDASCATPESAPIWWFELASPAIAAVMWTAYLGLWRRTVAQSPLKTTRGLMQATRERLRLRAEPPPGGRLLRAHPNDPTFRALPRASQVRSSARARPRTSAR